MLPVHAATIRIFLHILGAAVWVGGQLTLAFLLPSLSQFPSEARRALARRFSYLAWGAYALLIATGIWNILVIEPVWSSRYGTTLIVKLVFVAASGVAAFAHARSHKPFWLATFGALSVATALAALFLGVLLRT